MIFSQAVRQAEVEPGRANRKVALARPANARDCSVRSADLLEAQRAEQFAEAGHLLVEQRQQRFGGGIAAGEAGAAGDEDAVDGGIGDPVRHQRAQSVPVVGQQGAIVQTVAGIGQCGRKVVAGAVVGAVRVSDTVSTHSERGMKSWAAVMGRV